MSACHPQAESGVPKHSQLLGEFKVTVWGVGEVGRGSFRELFLRKAGCSREFDESYPKRTGLSGH